MFIGQCYSLDSSHPPCPLLHPQVCYLHLWLYSCPANRFICIIFPDSIYVFIYDTCFSLPDLLHSVWQTLRQSTAQQMTQFVTFYGWGIFLCNVPHLWVSRVVLVVENPPADGREVKDSGSVPGSGKCPGGEHGNPLQYSCLENPVDRGAWWLMVHRVTKSWTQLKRISTHTYHIFFIYSFVSGYLSYFYVLDIVNILQWTLECMWSFLLSSIQFSYNRPVKLQSSN